MYPTIEAGRKGGEGARATFFTEKRLSKVGVNSESQLNTLGFIVIDRLHYFTLSPQIEPIVSARGCETRS